MDRIREAVREAGIFVVLGYSERCKGSIYIAQVSRGSRVFLFETDTAKVVHRSNWHYCSPPT